MPEQPEPGSPQPPLSPLSQESGVRLAPPPQAPIPFQQDSFSFKPLGKILKRIPRASRGQAGSKLTLVLNTIVNKNDQAAWRRLLLFCPRCLQVPQRKPRDRHSTLASRVNKQLWEEVDPPLPPHRPSGPSSRSSKKGIKDPMAYLASRVSSKLEEGDFKGAVRLACTEDTIADKSDATLEALKLKHPPPHPDSSIPPLPEALPTITVSEEEIVGAIKSFPNGSAGGPDGLRPQHLKDMTHPSVIEGSALISALARFATLVLQGKIPAAIRPLFFGASLIALAKKDGGVRPIAVGCTLHRLAPKVASLKVRDEMAALLAPHQLGYGVRGGAEAAVHAARLYVRDLKQCCILKLDFKNAFNTLRRDKMLQAVQTFIPVLLPFVHSSYSAPSSLCWGDKIIQSMEGVQQGDPLGPLLFCLTIHPLVSLLKSELSIWYLDDGTIGGTAEVVRHDLEVVNREGAKLGLQLNGQKSEVVAADSAARGAVQMSIPGAKEIDPTSATLLGSPIGDIDSISDAISRKLQLLQIMADRLQHIPSHDALVLLRNSLAIPKLLYLLRSSPSFLSPRLKDYDCILRSTVSTITNTHLNNKAWTQASLPVKAGGLGIRSAEHLAPSAFLSSTSASNELVHHILPPRFGSEDLSQVETALTFWSQGHDSPPPPSPASHLQKAWDSCRVEAAADTLLENARDATSRARLLAASIKESGA